MGSHRWSVTPVEPDAEEKQALAGQEGSNPVTGEFIAYLSFVGHLPCVMSQPLLGLAVNLLRAGGGGRGAASGCPP